MRNSIRLLTMYTFPYPIADSGLFFDLSIMKMSKVETEEGWVLHIEYQLQNRYDASVRIPISIAYTADVITAHKLEGQVAHESIISRSVLDLQRNHIMYGYGGDHHIVFQSSDKRDFRIIFEPTSVNFTSIIINFFMWPEDGDYGLYQLTYDLELQQVVARTCLRTY